MKIPLTQGLFTEVDSKDFKFLSSFKWCAHRKKRTFYAVRNETNPPRTVLMHQQILGVSGRQLVDHRDRNGLNNRRKNLRLASASQNAANSGLPITNRSGFRGVSRYLRGNKCPWVAYITVGGRCKNLGYFSTPEEAAIAYNQAAKLAWGEFCFQNVL